MDAQIENDGLDLSELKDQIRKDAENRKRNGAPSFYRQLITQTFDAQTPPLPPLQLQPKLEKRDRYQLNDILAFHDEAFISNAYKAILKREPDDAGMAHFLKNLRNGRYSKLDVLYSLKFSPEGQNANVPIEGLGKLSVLRKAYRVPVVGYLLRLVVAIARLPVLIVNFRRLESHTMGQLERVAAHINDAVAHLSNENRRQYETLHKELSDLKGTVRLQMNSLMREQEKLVESLNTLQADLSSQVNETNRRATEQADVQERHAAELQATRVQLEKQIDDLIERLQKSRMYIAQQESRLSRLLDGTALPAVSTQPSQGEEDHLLDSLYFSLEDVLRGTPEQIKEEVKVYLPVLQKAGIDSDILDVGCGRGEWLQVLRENGFGARGIDTNRILVQQCKELDLDVEEHEALSYLRSLPDAGLNVVTAFHFAEHLPLETLVRFLDESAR